MNCHNTTVSGQYRDIAGSFRWRAVLGGLAVVALVLACPARAADRPTAKARPNIVVIISDDQTYTDFGFMGHQQVRTPNLDRMAARAARFVNGYVPSSVCRPSLATLLTGLYPHQHAIHFNHPPPGYRGMRDLPVAKRTAAREESVKLIEAVDTLPRLLSAAGYRTLQTGKHWEGHFRHAGFTDGMTLGKPHVIETELGFLSGHGNGDAGLLIGRQTMRPIFDFVDECRSKKQPFLVWYAPVMPHTPHRAPADIVNSYRHRSEVPDKAVDYYAAITEFDQTVGELIGFIEKRGLAERTVFVFVVDNGWTPESAGRPTKRSKRSPFEDGLRTPILLRWDGRVTPGDHATPVSTVSIVPTLLYAAGLSEAASKLPGANLLPSATGKRPLHPTPVFGEIYPGDAESLGDPERHVAYRWIRIGKHKLIVPVAGQSWGGYLEHPAVYDVVDDPAEQHNLIDSAECKAVATRLREELDRCWNPTRPTKPNEARRSPRPRNSSATVQE